MANNIETRLRVLEQAQASQEYPWLFIYGKPTSEQQARIDKATGHSPIICFWEDKPDSVWLAGCGKLPPWEMDIPAFHAH